MSNRVRCQCRRCTIRSLMGPAVIITIGIIFLLDQTRGGYFSFWNLSPVILIVIGAISLASSLASSEGHISGEVPPAPQPPVQNQPPVPPANYPGQGQ